MKINVFSTLIKVENFYNRIYTIIDSCKTSDQLNNAMTWAYDLTSYEIFIKRFNLDRIYKFGSFEYEYFHRHWDRYKDSLYKKIKNKVNEINEAGKLKSNKEIEESVKNFINGFKKSSDYQKDSIMYDFLNKDDYNIIKEGLNSCSNSVIMEFIFACVLRNNTINKCFNKR